MSRFFPYGLMLAAAFLVSMPGRAAELPEQNPRIPILVYHQVEPVAANEMTVSTAVFQAQMTYLRDNGYTVIPLRQAVAWLRGEGPKPLGKSVVITLDDGRLSAYAHIFPVLRDDHYPFTLFIYPSAISNAAYAMTWRQLQEIHDSGLAEIQSHSYWHPNFRVERRRLSPAGYAAFVQRQLMESRRVLEKKLNIRVDMLAWPFGIYDEDLKSAAIAAGYVAGFGIDRRPVTTADDIMALPRYIVTDHDRGAAFARLLSASAHMPGNRP